VPLDAAVAERRYERALADEDTPERLYERQWALTVLAGVLDDLRASYEDGGRAGVFDRLKGFLTGDEAAGTHADAAADLGMTPAAVKVAVFRLRQRYQAALRRRVADTVEAEEDVEDEIAHLLRTFRGPGV
jgi:RNA polymerase sigma-70 factor (ECF subfamily)